MNDIKVFQYSKHEEIWNWSSHLVGILFGIYAFIDLLFLGNSELTDRQLFCYLIYTLSMIALFTASTCYHYSTNEVYKTNFKKADHICIYVVIAGTYTPFLLLAIGGDTGLNFLYIVWSIALLGTVFKLFLIRRFLRLSVLTYLGMGWISVILWKPITTSLSAEGLKYIVIGGAFYTFGTIIYMLKKMPHHHMVWHLFVLAGTVFHYFAIKTI